MKVFVVYGQGGKLLSPAFVVFASQLRGLGFDVDDSFNWRQYGLIAGAIYSLNQVKKKSAIIGYSMGAWAGAMACTHAINVDLLVGYDQSGGWGPFYVSKPPPIGNNVKRCLHYEATTWGDIFASMPYEGAHVEHIKVSLPHTMIQGSPALHSRTIAELGKIKGP